MSGTHNIPWERHQLPTMRYMADQIRSLIAPHVHNECGPYAVDVMFDEFRPDAQMAMCTARITFPRPMMYYELAHVGELMAAMCHDHDGKLTFAHYDDMWLIGDGDDAAASWITGGVIHVWVRSWRDGVHNVG
jgi:hypothetical protein